jgi:hypothetical protein
VKQKGELLQATLLDVEENYNDKIPSSRAHNFHVARWSLSSMIIIYVFKEI